MTENQIKALIEKYLNGTISPKEEQLLEEFDKTLILKHAPTLLENVAQKQKLAKLGLKRSLKDSKRKRGKKLVLGIAASLLILVSLGLFFTKKTVDPPRIPEIQPVVKRTEWGEKLNLTLPDGSTVHLNSGSSLSFPASFPSEERVVELVGEAFFDVSKNPKKPFIIKSGELKTIVVGTSFNIKALEADSLIAVSVRTGKVKIRTRTEEIELLPNEQGILGKNSKKLSKRKVDIGEVLLWKDGTIIFEDAPLGEVARVLERWYGVTITFNNKRAKRCTLTGTYKKEYLTAVLESIVFAKKGLKYEFTNDKTIVFYGSCAKP